MKATLIDGQPAAIAFFRHLGSYGESIARFRQGTYVQWAVMNTPRVDRAR